MLLERARQILPSIENNCEWRIRICEVGGKVFLIVFNMWYYFQCNVSVVWHHKLPSDTHKISPNIDHSMKLMTNSARINGTYQQTVFIRFESNIDWSGYCVGCIIAMSICSSRIAGILSFVLWMVNISACLSEQLPRMSPLPVWCPG